MKSILIPLVMFTSLWADGLQFNKAHDHLAEASTVLSLTPDQKKQVERTRLVTLTDAQWKTLKQLGAACPKQLQVLTSRYDDCTCQLDSLAVWFTTGRIEVPHKYLPASSTTDGAAPSLPFEGLVVDPDGHLWLYGNPIVLGQIGEAMDQIARQNRARFQIPDSSPSSCWVETPPPGAIRNLGTIRQVVRKLFAVAKAKGIDLSVSGFDDSQRGSER